MTRARRFETPVRALPVLAMVLAMALVLQGCIAAVAIPVLAGGAIARTGVDGRDASEGEVPAGVARTPIDLAPVATPTPDIASAPQPRGIAMPAPALEMPVTAPPAARAPAAVAPGRAAGIRPADHPLHGYATSALSNPGIISSALLADPTHLSAQRSECLTRTATVLIDLDPAGGLAPLDARGTGDPALPVALDDLREIGVTIAWITDREAGDAGALRSALAATGLDPTGEDPLYIQRFPGETKQSRRQAIAETACLVAIAGDAREDFDDLYQFIRDPAAAQGLEALLGDGWFLIPNPLD